MLVSFLIFDFGPEYPISGPACQPFTAAGSELDLIRRLGFIGLAFKAPKTGKRPMRLAYFTQPVHPLKRGYAEILQENIDAVILADKLGYEEALFGEHFTDIAEPITSCLMFIARLMGTVKQITLGTGVTNLPIYHPVMLAGQIAMIDIQANAKRQRGRLVDILLKALGFGQGLALFTRNGHWLPG